MRRTTAILGVVLAAFALTPAEAKPESPKKALKRAYKDLRKLKSYRVTAHVQGGQAQGADHKVPSPKVNQTFECTVKGKVAEVNKKAFRWRFAGQNGAIKDGAAWKALLATKEGQLIGRLFLRPEEHLATALKHSKRAKWLVGQKSPNAPEADQPTDEADEEGTTSRKKNKAKRSRSVEITSNVIQIEAPAQLAVQRFNTIVSSGCFSEG